MTDYNPSEQYAATARVKKKRGFSIVWVVPIVALLIGGVLVIKAINDKGPVINITFANAEGLEAGKTKIKYKDVEIGKVESIALGEDLTHVVVTAELNKGSKPYLTDKTRFWVVRARVSGGSVSGLGTLLSGAYIGIDPVAGGKETYSFKGLEVPPVVTANQPGQHLWLHADQLGSVDIGTPVYYRQIKVGQVVSYGFSEDGQSVNIQIFVEAPHHAQVTQNTRFWNASGIDFSLGAEGIKVNTESLVSILSGGLAFDLPKGAVPGAIADDNTVFRLYPTHDSIKEKVYTIRRYWRLNFDQSVRGLVVGSPVELHGIKIGEVVSLELVFNETTQKFEVPVLVAIEPERIRKIGKGTPGKSLSENYDDNMNVLIEHRGLRAQLKTGNLLTGQLMVDLDFHPNAPKIAVTHADGYPVVPTIPGSFEQLQESLTRITAHLEKVPFEQIGTELQVTLKEARSTLKQTGAFAEKLNNETAPQVQATLVQLQNTLAELQGLVGQESPLNYNTQKALEELSDTLSTLRELTTTLEQQPQSIIFGKEDDSE